MFKCKTGIQF